MGFRPARERGRVRHAKVYTRIPKKYSGHRMRYAILASVGFLGLPARPCKEAGTAYRIPNAKFQRNMQNLRRVMKLLVPVVFREVPEAYGLPL